jgi:plasmid stability protein
MLLTKGGAMPGLVIKDLPKELHRRLKARAAASHRSMGREALVILREALDDRAGPPTLDEVDAMRVRGRAPLTDSIVEEARNSGRS